MPHATRRAAGAPIGLVPFLVPGWPSDAEFAALVRLIAEQGYAGFELALPASAWSPATGSLIAAALRESSTTLDEVLALARQTSPSIAVVYPSMVAQFGQAGVLDLVARAFDHVMLEDQSQTSAAWIEACETRGIGWVEVCAADRIDRRLARDLAERVPRDGALYLTLAPTTGASGPALHALEAAVAAIRSHRADIVITTGFGIAEPAQIARLAEIAELDSVAVGSELMRHLQHGASHAGTYYATLMAATGGRLSHAR